VLGLFVAAAALFYLGAQPQVSGWGSTESERSATWPGDELIAGPAFEWTNAVTVDRPAAEVWPWVLQLGQGRGGLYSYSWLENALGCDVHSADRVLPRYQQPLRVGDKVVRMCQYAPHNPVAGFVPERALVLGATSDSAEALRAGRPSSTWAFIVQPVGRDTSRLVVRSRDSKMSTRIQGPIQYVMQRRTMVGIKERAEGTGSSLIDTLEPLLWLLAAGVVAGGGVRAVFQRTAWQRPLYVAGAAAVVLPWLMFWQPPVLVGIAAAALLVAALVWSIRSGRDAAGEPYDSQALHGEQRVAAGGRATALSR
jgi:hypothetical protein